MKIQVYFLALYVLPSFVHVYFLSFILGEEFTWITWTFMYPEYYGAKNF